MTMGMVAVAGATLIGGALSAHAAGKAADTQAASAQAGIDTQNAQFDKVQSLLSPYVQASTGTPGGGFDAAAYLAQNPDVAADPYYSQHPEEHFDTLGRAEGRTAPITQAKQGSLGAYQDLIGLNGTAPQQTAISGIQNGAEFGSLAKQGQDALLQAASATGGLRGGNTENSLATFRSNLLSSLIDKQLGRLGGVTEMGQNSAARVGSSAMTMGQGVSTLLQQQGAAQAGGIMSGTKAITGAINNLGGFYAGNVASTSSAGVPPPANPYVAAPNFGTGIVTDSVGGNFA